MIHYDAFPLSDRQLCIPAAQVQRHPADARQLQNPPGKRCVKPLLKIRPADVVVPLPQPV